MPDDLPTRAGHPRLVLSSGGHAEADSQVAEGHPREYLLTADVVTIGSDPASDICLSGLEPTHAEIRYVAADDEFVVVSHVPDLGARLDGGVANDAGIHHGDRLRFAGWELVFQRDESADHVRKGEQAREGGEYRGGGITSAGGESTEPDHS